MQGCKSSEADEFQSFCTERVAQTRRDLENGITFDINEAAQVLFTKALSCRGDKHLMDVSSDPKHVQKRSIESYKANLESFNALFGTG